MVWGTVLRLSVLSMVAASPVHASVFSQDAPLDTASAYDCPTTVAVRFVSGLGERRICVYGTNPMVGMILSGADYRLVRGHAFSGELYLFEGVCEGRLGCIYDPTFDHVIEKIWSGDRYSLRLYSDVVSGSALTVRAQDGSFRYGVSRNVTSYDVQSDLDEPFSIEAFAVSSNGRWVIAEARDRGLLRINTQTKEVLRVTQQGYMYGRGMDPQHSLAIDDAGTSVVAIGLNAGFMVYNVTQSCGIPLNRSFESRSEPYRDCIGSDYGIGNAVAGFRHATHVSFLPGGEHFLLEYRTQAWLPRQVRVGESTLSSVDYIALGDSFTSGEGEADDQWYMQVTEYDAACHRSSRAYPLVWNDLFLKLPYPLLVACSGAHLGDVAGAGAYSGQAGRLTSSSNEQIIHAKRESLSNGGGGVVRQADFLQLYRPSVASISIGGNDVGLMAKLKSCLSPGVCSWAGSEMRQTLRGELDAFGVRLRETLDSVRSHAPRTNFILAGYPMPIEDVADCHGITGVLFTTEERQLFRETILYLNSVLKGVAQGLGMTYRDISKAFAGDALCAKSGKSMNDVRFGDDIAPLPFLPELTIFGAESFHPTFVGHQKIGRWLANDAQNETLLPNDSYWNVGDSTARVTHLRYAPEILTDQTEQSVSIHTASHIFEPHSSVRITVQSDERILAQLNTADDGSVSTSVSLPDELDRGYHTVNVYGTSSFGAQVRLYADIFHQPNVEKQLLENSTGRVAPTELSQTNTRLSNTETQQPNSIQPVSEPAVLGSSDTKRLNQLSLDLILGVALLLGLSIITAWHLYVRLLKK